MRSMSSHLDGAVAMAGKSVQNGKIAGKRDLQVA